jgi:aminocarboxymuconate-semialdehyde decarboxylase
VTVPNPSGDDHAEPWAEAGDRYGRTAVGKPAVKTVDVHSHLAVPEAWAIAEPHFTPERDPRTLASPEETLRYNRGYHQSVSDKFTTAEVRLADMDAMGIDVQAISISPVQYGYWLDADLASRLAAAQNEAIAAMVASHPDRFVGLGTLPLAHPRTAAAEVGRVVDLGLRGVELGTDADGTDLDDGPLEPVWEALAGSGLPILLHPSGYPESGRLGDYYMVNVVGMPLASTVALTRMILGGVLDRHPGLRIVAVHGGGYLPLAIARVDHAFKHRPELQRHLTRPPSEYLDRVWFDTTVFDPELVAALVARFGAGRVLLGTDYPFDMGEGDPLALLAAAGLTDDEVAMVAGGNALELFGAPSAT